ncbi:MAG: hypothetical protein J6Q55_04030, partial [Clostridia bacterium]|nr:hypothetical protein [Clostridia bacterium]
VDVLPDQQTEQTELQPANKISVAVVDPHVIEVRGDIPATQVLLVLAQNGVTATNIVTIGDDLEHYYIDLLNGGAQNA